MYGKAVTQDGSPARLVLGANGKLNQAQLNQLICNQSSFFNNTGVWPQLLSAFRSSIKSLSHKVRRLRNEKMEIKMRSVSRPKT